MDANSWPRRLRDMRTTLKLSQQSFAVMLGLTIGVVCACEGGKRTPAGLSALLIELLESVLAVHRSPALVRTTLQSVGNQPLALVRALVFLERHPEASTGEGIFNPPPLLSKDGSDWPVLMNQILRKLKLTQLEFADLLSFSTMAVNRWKRGRVRPGEISVVFLELLTNALDAHPGKRVVWSLRQARKERLGVVRTLVWLERHRTEFSTDTLAPIRRASEAAPPSSHDLLPWEKVG